MNYLEALSKNCNIIDLKDAPIGSDKWHEARSHSIGGSDAMTILSISDAKYQSPYEIWEQKVGMAKSNNEQEVEVAAYMGIVLEKDIKDQWESWEFVDNDAEDMYFSWKKTRENYLMNKKLRYAIKPNEIFVSKKYPWMHATLDGLFVNENKELCGIEIKTINGFALKKWEHGIPWNHLVQVYHYMAVTGIRYFELAMLVDGRDLKVYPVHWDEKWIKENIIEPEKNWWNNYVIKKTPPPIDGSPALEELLKQHWAEAPIFNITEGTPSEFDLVNKRKEIDNKMKELKDQQREIDNQFRKKFIDKQVNIISFGVNGSVENKPYGQPKDGKQQWRLSYKV